MNRIVFCPEVRIRFVAAARARRISATLLSTPLKRTNLACVMSAMMWASVVFPVPGGPERITDGKRSALIARLNNFPGARMCSWPTNSSIERGRIRVANGAALFTAARSTSSSSNKSCTLENTTRRKLCTRAELRAPDVVLPSDGPARRDEFSPATIRWTRVHGHRRHRCGELSHNSRVQLAALGYRRRFDRARFALGAERGFDLRARWMRIFSDPQFSNARHRRFATRR